jgi:hypothetical protein
MEYKGYPRVFLHRIYVPQAYMLSGIAMLFCRG